MEATQTDDLHYFFVYYDCSALHQIDIHIAMSDRIDGKG